MNPNDRATADSYYEATRNYRLTAPPIRGDHRADVVVIGGGLTGVSAALHLAEAGVSVALLESRHIGWGASGRSGGQIIVGYSCDQRALESAVGVDTSRELWAHSVAAVRFVRERIARHKIACDFTENYLHAAIKPRHARDLRAWSEHLAAHYDYQNLTYLERDQLRDILASRTYTAAVADTGSGHLHPLNYCLGLARAAQEAGAKMHEDSAVVAVENSGESVTVKTAHGSVKCAQIVYACNAYLAGLQPKLSRAIMPVGTCIIATEPLARAAADALIANRAAVADTSMVLDYYRLSADHRMLFGGRVSYLALEPRRLLRALRRRMSQVFPQLGAAKIDFAWGGYVAITRNRAPHIGRRRNEFFAQGFSGHGMALSGYAGGLLADAVLGDDRAVQTFARIPHRDFPGGQTFRTPMLVAAMTALRLRDALP